MGKYGVIAAFDQLAAEYLNESKDKEKARAVVESLRRELKYELSGYYGVDRTTHSRKALFNDVKGVAKK